MQFLTKEVEGALYESLYNITKVATVLSLSRKKQLIVNSPHHEIFSLSLRNASRYKLIYIWLLDFHDKQSEELHLCTIFVIFLLLVSVNKYLVKETVLRI